MKQKFQQRLAKWLDRPTRPDGINDADGLGAIGTTVGNVRSENQDRAVIARYSSRFPSESFVFYGLCDGIGGLRDGGVCASLALSGAILELIANCREELFRRMRDAAFAANEDIFRFYHENGGCTYSAVCLTPSFRPQGINVGDSRIYARDQTGLVQISSDDNIESQLQLLGNFGSGGTFSKQLTQYLGMGPSLQPKSVRLPDEKNLFITSDGIHYLGEKMLSEFVERAPTASETVKRITSVVTWAKGADNGTIICLPRTTDYNHIFRESFRSPGLLEVWDSFGKLEMFVNSEDVERSRCLILREDASFHGPQHVFTDSQKKKPIQKKRKKLSAKGQGLPEIEITENPET
ncbi:MAG TPA: hypothetical protein VFW05_00865 [Verrucomicrobiae bacterium]|nr:hypothetical protein [Verrucomicrobiae bacterium]